MAQIISITSEALQATIRRLLPSQRGFGEDLQASNVITPVIDLTPSAEGDTLGVDLQTAFSFADVSAFDVTNTTTSIITNTGFFRIFGVAITEVDSATRGSGVISMSDGLSTKNLVNYEVPTVSNGPYVYVGTPIDIVVFLTAGESVSITCNGFCRITGNTRQIADINGNLVNPTGYTPQ